MEDETSYKNFKRELDEKDTSRFYIDGEEVNKEAFIREQDRFRLSPVQILRQDSTY